GRISRPEIVHMKLDVHRLDLLEHDKRGFGIVHDRALGELELEKLWIDAGFIENFAELWQKIRHGELFARDVDAHRELRDLRAALLPVRQLPARLLKDPDAQ